MRDGLLIVDKPAGWTSHDVVGRARRLAHTRRVGHAGTLDPMATGVLVLGIGRATKLLTYLVGCDKAYTATIRLGQSTVTDDAEGEITGEYDVSDLRDDAILGEVGRLTGDVQQVPSSVSAIKIGGKRSYARVRGGEDVTLPARAVRVERFQVVARRDHDGVSDLEVEVEVSSGTYVRALARDLGAALGVGGHLTALRRTRVGTFTLDAARPLEELCALELEELPVLPMGAAAGRQLAVRVVSEQEAVDLRHGKRLAPAGASPEPVAALSEDGELIAILDEGEHEARSRVVFPERP
ncbi:tRNA pseudouridine(55) synthase TruB [Leekyejoonella antrihumi]|uniref:tRNA pseudouridine(55) synthase TruB n=1 Tax=Leekyejoonella antrihumi TaxID=1660198 RepID=UPI001FE7F934|nr:tRNA pseudouridine(55) synthase TruB [Leekyejoonella antrihumi]